ncbi:hypothetical protein [Methanobrevibacter sp.]|uniref:hypothetical protein n=1 Tax=Methanobrevibacter sp. TaxID=66852 RepID=UPI0025FC7436|nr:hypothetical protein [Methanobrevibacter sp.]MBQ2831561.1 hypothetical protein [Methanobrevibacter sp.]
MKFKHVIIILMFLCFFISLANVSASDNAAMENVSAIDEEIDLEVSKSIETIDDLDREIQNAAPNSTIKLENDLIVNQNTTCKGIEVSERIILDGQGHKIDGNSSGAPFFIRVHGEGVVLKNIVFVNWDSSDSYNLVEWIGGNGELRNCTFINNTAVNGGAVDWTGINGFLINCTFINNAAENGGGLYWYGLEGTIANCIFTNNTAEVGGAAYITGKDVKLDGSKFEINSADDIGGAVYSDGLNFVLSKCDFINNTALNGGAVYSTAYPNLIESCNFTFNSADDTAGALYLASDNNTVKDSIFTNNSANMAGAIYSDVNDDLYVFNSKFNNNSANEFGGAIMIDQYAEIVNSSFDSNSAGIGGAVYSDSETYFSNSTFTNNKADNGGAVAMVDGGIVNSTFANNFANESGGAISGVGELNVNKTDFTKNMASDGSNNIYSDGGEVTTANVTSDSKLISKNLDISVDIPIITYGESLKINIAMPGNITNGTVTVKVNGRTYNVDLTSNQTTVTVPDLNSGNYTVEVSYESIDYNTPISKNDAVVLKKNVTISADKKSFVINYAGKYSITVKDQKGNVISGEQVTVYISNKKINTVTTNKNGVATVTITASKLKSLKAGTKTLNVTLSDNYNPNSTSVKVTINKEKTKVVAVKKTFKKSLKTKKYTVTLKNSKNKVIKNAKVSLKVKGKTYTAKTNSKGKATFKITKLNKKGKFTAKIAFKTTSYYKGVSKNVIITIK